MTENSGHEVAHAHRQMVKGTAWVVLMRTVVRVMGLANTIFLVRLLDADDFGIVAMAFLIINLLQYLFWTEVDSALVRAAKVTREQYDMAWTINVITGTALSLLLFASAPFVADFFREPRAEWVMLVLATQPIISGFENIGTLDFRRDLQFHKEFIFWTVKKLSGVFLGLGLAVYFKDYRALAIAYPLAALATVALTYVMSPFRPRFRFRGSGELWRYSKWMVFANVGVFGARRGDEFVVGRTEPATVLGQYTVASDIAYIPLQEMLESVGRALLPTYRILQAHPEELYATFWKVLGLTAVATISVSTGLAIVSDDLVHVVLGEKWADAVQYFQWLAFAAAGMGSIFVLKDIFTTLQLERNYGLAQFSATVLSVTAMAIVGSIADAREIATTRAFCLAGFCTVMLIYLCRLTHRSPLTILGIFWRPVLSAIAMAEVVSRTHGVFATSHGLSLISDVLVGAVTFAVSLILLWLVAGRPKDGAESTIISVATLMIRSLLERAGRRRQ